jgi:hypothetical protein
MSADGLARVKEEPPDSRRSTAMSFAVIRRLNPHTRPTVLEESTMTATYTFDAFSSLDERIASRTLGGNIQALIHRPARQC